MKPRQFDVYAIRYASAQRRRSDNFVIRDPHDGPMPIDYFIWVVKSEQEAIVVDCGFGEAAAEERKRNFLYCPVEALKIVGVNPLQVSDVIITHLHYDHAGNLDKFPNARFHLQENEMKYATGCNMVHGVLKHPYNVDDIIQMVRFVFANRVVFHDGSVELTPGLSVHLVGGHSDGLQVVRVNTKRGWLVLASDASHYYENILAGKPFPLVYSVGDMLRGYRVVLDLAQSTDHIVPGHDPLVLQIYNNIRDVGAYEAVCLSEEPLSSVSSLQFADLSLTR